VRVCAKHALLEFPPDRTADRTAARYSRQRREPLGWAKRTPDAKCNALQNAPACKLVDRAKRRTPLKSASARRRTAGTNRSSPKGIAVEIDVRADDCRATAAAATHRAATYGRRTSLLNGRVNDELLKSLTSSEPLCLRACNPIEQDARGLSGSISLIFGQPH